MSTRLLSFLSEIESAIAKESASNMGPSWDASRIVSYHQSLARMTLTSPKGAEDPAPGGTIFLQSFLLSDGSPCLKASLSWEGSSKTSAIAVFSKPLLDWKAEAKRIASTWLSGPTAQAEAAEAADLAPLNQAVG
jgi:hypothetical protein